MGSEDDEFKKKEVLKKLLCCSPDVMDSVVDNSNRNNKSQTLIFGNNSFVSFSRGMDCSYNDRRNTIIHSTPFNSKSKETALQQSPYTDEKLIFEDEDFFDSETGKQMIFNDQASCERLSVQRTDCTGCSSWTLRSQKKLASIPLNFSGIKQKENISIGEYIGRFSETVSFSDIHKKQNIFENCFTSTPKNKRRSRSMSSLLDMENKSNNSFSSLDNGKNELLDAIGTPTSIKPLNFSFPKIWNETSNPSGDFHYFIDRTSRQNIERVRAEEKRKQGLDEVVSFDSQQTDKTATLTNFPGSGSGATGSDTTAFALRSGTFSLTNGNMTESSHEWFIDPEIVLLDANKGSRVRLINNSTKRLKFKTSFDSRIINSCPLSGTVPAMDQIGLRILIAKYAKKQIESFESDIKVIIGKNEKNIHVKFVPSVKSKSSKERSYISY